MLKTEFIFVPKVDCKIFHKIKETSVLLKGVQIKTLVLNVCFAHISASTSEKFFVHAFTPTHSNSGRKGGREIIWYVFGTIA